ncbi:MAG: hypothetical protein PUA96_05155 [Bacteroidales bacterium]|nr:hypothetical protein [Bacteroidales bacterium]
MLKKILIFIAVSTAAMSSMSCSTDDSPSIEFNNILYTVYERGSVDVKLYISEPAATALNIPLTFGGNASEGIDYEVSSKSVSIAAGETEGFVTISNISLSTEKQLSLSFSAPAGYRLGAKNVAVVAADPAEALVYSFAYESADVLEGYVARINVTGAVSGKDVVTSEDIAIPISVSGEGAGHLVFIPEAKSQPVLSPCAMLYAGETSATVRFKVEDGYSGDLAALLTVNSDQATRFIPGDNEDMILNLKGLQTPDKLVGTWEFKEIFSLEEIELFFMDEEDDPDLLPTHNEGFTLTFAKEPDGSISITPSGDGDFSNFFRKATVTLSAPVVENMTSEGYALGSYTTSESNMFMADAGYPEQINTYYKLSSANRAFSAESESLGESTVVFALMKDGLHVEFRDYDQPPFGESWWGWGGYDPDMFGFASLFVKK